MKKLEPNTLIISVAFTCPECSVLNLDQSPQSFSIFTRLVVNCTKCGEVFEVNLIERAYSQISK